MHHSEAQVKSAIEACRAFLTEEQYREVSELNELHGEWGVAIELVADWLADSDAKIRPQHLRLIEDAFSSMSLDPAGRTDYLRQLMAHDSK